MAKKLSQSTLRAVARVLSTNGIGKSIDARKTINQSAIRGGKTLAEWADKLDPVISGKAAIVARSEVSDKAYRKLYERANIINPKSGKKSELLIVPHSADEVVRVDKGRIVLSHPAGIDRTQIPIEYHNLGQWIEEMEETAAEYPGEKGVQYGFRFYGGSSSVFRNLELLIDELSKYQTVQDAVAGDSKFQRDVYRNIEIVKVLNKKTWFAQREKNISARKKKRGKMKGKKRG